MPPSTNKPDEQSPPARFRRYREPRFQSWPRWPVRRLRLRWNHEALPSKHVFPMVLTFAILPFCALKSDLAAGSERLCDRIGRVSCDSRAPSADCSASSALFCAQHALSVTRSTSSGSKGAPNRRSNAPRLKLPPRVGCRSARLCDRVACVSCDRPGSFGGLLCAAPHCSAPTTRFPSPEELPRVRRERPAEGQKRRDSELPPRGAHRPDARTRSGSGEPPLGPVLSARASSRHQAERVGRSPPVFRGDRGCITFRPSLAVQASCNSHFEP